MDFVWFTDIVKDIHDSWYQLRTVDFAQPVFVLLWLFIVFLPLGQVDRRDILAGLVYSLFSLALGVALIFALPKEFVPKPSLATQFMSVLGMVILTCARWFYVASQELTPVPDSADKNNEGG